MSLRILIVDDSITVRAVLKKVLDVSNLEISEVILAVNGREGLDVLNEREVDLVFTDLVMPEMTGEEMIERLHEQGLTAQVPVVVISSAGGTPRIRRLTDMGVRGFIHKPFTPEQVEKLIIEHTGVMTS